MVCGTFFIYFVKLPIPKYFPYFISGTVFAYGQTASGKTYVSSVNTVISYYAIELLAFQMHLD